MKNIFKKMGLSVQSIIIGRVISGVIRGGGISILWDSIEKREFNTELKIIKELDLSIMSHNRMTSVENVNFTSDMNNLPQEFEYVIFTIEQFNNRDSFLVTLRDNTNSKEVSKIKMISKRMNKFIDNTSSNSLSDLHDKNIRYKNTCLTDNDCYLIYRNVRGRGKLPSSDSFNIVSHLENVKSLTSKSLLETIKNGTKRGKILNGNITYTFSSFK